MTDIKEILNIDEAAQLLGVSVKTFNKVLHSESIPARKVGREWKFSRSALIEWVGSGTSEDFYRDSRAVGNGSGDERQSPGGRGARRTSGWRLELD